MKQASSLPVLLVLAALAAPARGQEPGVVFQEAVDVTVVELEVVVTDRQGRPVTDLQKGDFELFEDGKRVKISNFSVVRPQPGEGAHELPAPPPPADEPGALPLPLAAAPESGSFLVIYLDGRHLRPQSRARVLEPLTRYLTANPSPRRQVMVVSYDGGIQVEQRFTRDVSAAARALEQTLARSDGGVERDSLWTTAVRALGEIYELRECVDGKPEMINMAQNFAAQIRAEVEGSLRALGETVNSLAGLPGKKAVLYVSDGLALEGGQGLFALIDNWCPFGTGELDFVGSASTSYQQSASFSSLTVLRHLTAHASRNGVALYALQATGLPGYPHTDVDADDMFVGPEIDRRALPGSVLDFGRRINLQHALTAMAAETGGQAFLDGKDVARSMEALDRDLTYRYSLGYLPQRSGDRKDHRLEVRVKRKGVRVRHRRSHRDFSNWERMANRTLGTLWYHTEFNPLRLEVAFGASREIGEEAHNLPILLRIPLESLQLFPDGDDYIGQLSLFFAAEDAAGRKASPVHATVPVRVPALQYLEAYRHRIHHPVTLMLRAGTNRLAVGAWDEVGREYSVFYREVEIPSPGPSASE